MAASLPQRPQRGPNGLRAPAGPGLRTNVGPRFSRLPSLVRLLSFFFKELNEIRRQPRLVLSLLLGPFLVLLLFGLGYQGGQPNLRTALVLPPDLAAELPADQIAFLADTNFSLVTVDSDREAAMAALRRGEVDVVQIFPNAVEAQIRSGTQATIEFASNEINPLNEQWIQYLAYAEVVEINRALLIRSVLTLQDERSALLNELAEMRTQLVAIEQRGAAFDQADLRALSARLRAASATLAAGVAFAGGQGAAAHSELTALRADLDALDTAIAQGDAERSLAQVTATRQRIQQAEAQLNVLGAIPAEVIVSPLTERHQNLSGASYDLMTFYAPGVLALLVQHIAVTLGALALVRERLLGAVELFRVAPIGLSHVLVGKLLCYTSFIGLMAALLLALMRPLGVPILGDPLLLAGLLLLLTIASLGIGLLISALSRSESQAVQLSMFVLLLSVFFSGFFLPLQNFWPPVRAVAYSLPLTHGITGLLNLMLRGTPPESITWVGLAAIALLTLALAPLLERREFYRA